MFIEKAVKTIKKEKLNIVLIGMAGCGKSTIAKELSKRTGKPLIDTDQLVEQKENRIGDLAIFWFSDFQIF